VMRRKTLSHHHPSKLHLENAEDWIDGRWGGDKIREISEKAGVLLFSFLGEAQYVCLYENYILLLVVTIKRQKIICLPFIINNMFCLVFKIILHYYLLGLELEFHIPTFCMILFIN
jgi:hypothetical protein